MRFLSANPSSLKTTLFVVFCVLPLMASAQWGPGGVGNTNGTTQNSVRVQPAMRGWYRADNGPNVSNGKVTSWVDRSGRNINVFQSDESLQPTFVTNAVNSRPVVRFSGVSNAMLSGNVVASGSVSSSAMTIFAVARNSATSSSVAGLISYNGYQGMICSYTTGTGTQYIVDGNGANASTSANTSNITTSTFRLLAGIYGGSSNTNLSRMFMDGNLEDFQNGGGFPSLSAYSQVQIGGRTWGSFPARIFSGDIAELIVYDTQLDSAQRIIVENYLAAKYGTTLARSRYAYAPSNRFDLAGIGQAFNGSKHDSAASNIITVAAPQSLANNRYMLFGHNNSSLTLGTNETPGNDVNFVRRIDREWRFNKTGGNLGTTKLYIDFTSINASIPAGFTRGIFIDADGDFRSGATFVDLLPSSANVYVTPAINIPDGSVVTVGAVKRVASFALSSSQGFEDQTEYPVITAQLNFAYAASSSIDVVGDYTVAPYGTYLPAGPCADDNACDFDNGRTQFIIPAGQTSVDLNQDAFDIDAALRIHNDTAAEPNAEVVRLAITSVTNASLGNQVTHDYSIIDDDFFRKLSFVSGQNAYTWNELDAGQYKDTSFVITLPSGQTGGPSFVTVSATGPCKANKDYRFLDAINPTDSLVRLSIDDASQSVRVRIRLLGDDVNENTEVLSLTLTRPSSATLSGVNPITASITLLDNDALPQVSFAVAASSGAEDIGTVQIKVKLNIESGKQVTVPFSLGSGTATSNGNDFDVTSPSPIYIYPGDTVAYINLSIIEDDVEEDDETVILNFGGSPTNATTGSPASFTYTIQDNDVYGSTGPAGVDKNDGTGSLELWFSADENVTVTSGSVTRWGNLQGGPGRDATTVSGYGTPTLVTNQLNGKPVIRFNGQMLGGSLVTPIPGSPVTIITVAKQNSTPPTVSGRTYGGIFCTDRWAGISSYGSDYLLEGFTTSPSFIYPDASNTANTSLGTGGINQFRILSGQYTQNSTQNSFLYSNAALAENYTSTGPALDIHSQYRLGIRYPNNSGYFFRGDVAEILFFSSNLNPARRLIIETYLASKYGLTLSSSYYTGQGSDYNNNVAGIGTSDGLSNNKHRTATSSGLTVRQLNNTLNAANEYLFFGRNSGGAATIITTVAGGQSEVWTRNWYVKKTGSIDARFTFDYDAVGLSHVPLAVTEYYLLYRSGTSGSWTKTTFTGRTLVGNKISFDVADAQIADGYYTLGRTDPAVLPVVFGSFDAYRKGKNVQVRWTTESESNSDRFEIERSADGKSYVKIGSLQAAGFSLDKLSYAWLDEAPLVGKAFYRLRQVDRDQKTMYSGVRQVTGNASVASFTKLTVFPNPTTGFVNVSLPQDIELEGAQIFDSHGIRISGLDFVPDGDVYRADVSNLKAGLYLLHLRLATGEVQVRSMVKQ